MTTSDRIVTTPNVCGGKPRIAGHRIKVQHVAVWHLRMGLTLDEIVSQHPGLMLADVHAAMAYYSAHREQIQRDIKAGQAFADELRGDEPSIFEKVRS